MDSSEFIRVIAAMTKDGEELDGEEFVMENDDAVETLCNLISLARELLPGNALRPEAIIRDGTIYCGHEGCDKEVDELAEDGYRRTWSLRMDGQRPEAIFNGSEDWSDDGDFEYKVVCLLGHESEPPFDTDKIEWM